jgi:hypothetical protein
MHLYAASFLVKQSNDVLYPDNRIYALIIIGRRDDFNRLVSKN